MALVNAFIISKACSVKKGDRPIAHADFLDALQTQLLGLKGTDIDAPVDAISREQSTKTKGPLLHLPKATHFMAQTEDRVKSGIKRRGRVCKVCSVLSDGTHRKHETTFFCVQCGDERGE